MSRFRKQLDTMRLTGTIPPTTKTVDAALTILKKLSPPEGMKTREIYQAATSENLPPDLLDDGANPFPSMRYVVYWKYAKALANHILMNFRFNRYLKTKVLEDLKRRELIEKRHHRAVTDSEVLATLKSEKQDMEAKKPRWLWSIRDMKREAEEAAKRAQQLKASHRSWVRPNIFLHFASSFFSSEIYFHALRMA